MYRPLCHSSLNQMHTFNRQLAQVMFQSASTIRGHPFIFHEEDDFRRPVTNSKAHVAIVFQRSMDVREVSRSVDYCHLCYRYIQQETPYIKEVFWKSPTAEFATFSNCQTSWMSDSVSLWYFSFQVLLLVFLLDFLDWHPTGVLLDLVKIPILQ